MEEPKSRRRGRLKEGFSDIVGKFPPSEASDRSDKSFSQVGWNDNANDIIVANAMEYDEEEESMDEDECDLPYPGLEFLNDFKIALKIYHKRIAKGKFYIF